MNELFKPLEMHPDAIKREKAMRKLSDEIAELNAQIQAATYRFLLLIRDDAVGVTTSVAIGTMGPHALAPTG